MDFCSLVVAKTKDTKQTLNKYIIDDSDGNSFQFNSDKCVTNVSSVKIFVFEKESLSIGFNFSVEISDLSIDAQFETFYDPLNFLVPTAPDKQN